MELLYILIPVLLVLINFSIYCLIVEKMPRFHQWSRDKAGIKRPSSVVMEIGKWEGHSFETHSTK